MEIALLSDPHLTWYKPVGRLDNARTAGFNKFEHILIWCEEHKAPLYIAGDLTEEPRSWFVAARLASLLLRYRVNVYAVFGQHDTYMYSEKTWRATVLGLLMSSGLIKRLTDMPLYESVLGTDIAAYGYNYTAKEQKVKPAILAAGILNLLVIHAPIAENALWRGQNYISAEKFLQDNDTYDIILCGDIHRKFIIMTKGKRFSTRIIGEFVGGKKRFICNTGPLLRKDASLYMLKHEPGFWTFDTERGRMQWETVPFAAAEDVLTRKHLYEDSPVESRQEFIESVRTELAQTDTEDLEDVREDIIAFLKRVKAPKRLVDLMAEVIMEE